MKKKVELLAPAGNYETMVGAFNAGADAVYLGGSKFGARAYADNFDEAQVLDAISYAHLHHKKIYMTVNTLVKEREFSEVYDFMLPYAEKNLDGRRLPRLADINLECLPVRRPSDRARRHVPGRKVAAEEQGKGVRRAAREAVRDHAGAAEQGAGGRPQESDRLR